MAFGCFINDCPSELYVEKVKKCTVGWTENSMLSHHFSLWNQKQDWKTFRISVYKAVLPFLSCKFGMILWLTFINDCPSGLLCRKSQKMHIRMSSNSMLSHHFFSFKWKQDWKIFHISVWWKKIIKSSKRFNFCFGSFINDCPSGLYVEKVKKCCTVGWTEIPCCHVIFFPLKSKTRLKNISHFSLGCINEKK